MIETLLVIVWVLFTFFIFKLTHNHNKKEECKDFKATWEPYLISIIMATLMSMYWFAQQL